VALVVGMGREMLMAGAKEAADTNTETETEEIAEG